VRTWNERAASSRRTLYVSTASSIWPLRNSRCRQCASTSRFMNSYMSTSVLHAATGLICVHVGDWEGAPLELRKIFHETVRRAVPPAVHVLAHIEQDVRRALRETHTAGLVALQVLRAHAVSLPGARPPTRESTHIDSLEDEQEHRRRRADGRQLEDVRDLGRDGCARPPGEHLVLGGRLELLDLNFHERHRASVAEMCVTVE
jgi:hypothetical protein